jgi:dihydrofolate reductase
MIFERILGIAACDPQGIMGRNGKLPWHCPEDLKHFSTTTRASPMIMGRQTFLSLPAHYFDRRVTIVFTRQKEATLYPDLIFVSSLTEFLTLDGVFKDLYVIGGAQIYSLFLQANLIEEFILTTLKSLHEGDTFFPLSLLHGWSSLKIQETSMLSIHRYFNPLGDCACT